MIPNYILFFKNASCSIWALFQIADKLRQEVRSYRPHNNLIDIVRILLVGSVGTGKSSFVNSVLSALKNTLVQVANVQDTSGQSVTEHVRKTSMTKHVFIIIENYWVFMFICCLVSGIYRRVIWTWRDSKIYVVWYHGSWAWWEWDQNGRCRRYSWWINERWL